MRALEEILKDLQSERLREIVRILYGKEKEDVKKESVLFYLVLHWLYERFGEDWEENLWKKIKRRRKYRGHAKERFLKEMERLMEDVIDEARARERVRKKLIERGLLREDEPLTSYHLLTRPVFEVVRPDVVREIVPSVWETITSLFGVAGVVGLVFPAGWFGPMKWREEVEWKRITLFVLYLVAYERERLLRMRFDMLENIEERIEKLKKSRVIFGKKRKEKEIERLERIRNELLREGWEEKVEEYERRFL